MGGAAYRQPQCWRALLVRALECLDVRSWPTRTHADVESSGGRLIAFLLTVGGMLIFVLMIGIIADGMSGGLDALKRTIATEWIKARFKEHSTKTGKKLSLPTGDETIDYMGKPMTREDLIKAMLNKQAAAIETEAKRRQAVQQEGADAGEDLF